MVDDDDAPVVGEVVRDTRRDRVGEVMACLGGVYQLRPLLGGREWDARPEEIQPMSAREELSARLAESNARSGWRVSRY